MSIKVTALQENRKDWFFFFFLKVLFLIRWSIWQRCCMNHQGDLVYPWIAQALRSLVSSYLWPFIASRSRTAWWQHDIPCIVLLVYTVYQDFGQNKVYGSVSLLKEQMVLSQRKQSSNFPPSWDSLPLPLHLVVLCRMRERSELGLGMKKFSRRDCERGKQC